MASAQVLTDAYITLTPRSSVETHALAHSAPTFWPASGPPPPSARREPEPEDERSSEDRDSSLTETDRSSEIGNDETPSTDGSEVAAEEEEDDEKEDDEEEEEDMVTPTYVCELHDPKPVLVAEQTSYNRVDIEACELSTRGHEGGASVTTYRYEISVGKALETFSCSPSKVLEVFRTLSKDKKLAGQLRFIEMN